MEPFRADERRWGCSGIDSWRCCKWWSYRLCRRNPWIYSSIFIINKICRRSERIQKDVEAKIITVEPEEQRLVLSAKAVEKEKERKERENKINELKVGTVVEGTVENIMPYGAFVDIGDGISGLVHISQLSQKRVKSPEEVVKEGDAVTVKIIKVANGKVSLSIKALEEDKEAAKKAEETGVEYTEDAAGTSLGDLLANIKL